MQHGGSGNSATDSDINNTLKEGANMNVKVIVRMRINLNVTIRCKLNV